MERELKQKPDEMKKMMMMEKDGENGQILDD